MRVVGLAGLALIATLGSVDVASAQQTQAPPAAAQPAPTNPCTGLAEAQCGSTAGCSWLAGYKIKGAADVPGYCRTAPKPLTGRRQQG